MKKIYEKPELEFTPVVLEHMIAATVQTQSFTRWGSERAIDDHGNPNWVNQGWGDDDYDPTKGIVRIDDDNGVTSSRSKGGLWDDDEEW
ncbi:MAG: hypothetical protein IJ562_12240 [Prevotella sp.]|nr:hypothetical protein [Prevotella sp.]